MNIFKSLSLTVLIGVLAVSSLSAQTDSLVMNNGQTIVGEIKGMSRSVVTIETDYSDSDFKIDWDEVSQVYSDRTYLLTLSDGSRLNASVNSDASNPNSVILDTPSENITTSVNEIVYIKPLEGDFISRMSASVSVGYNLTKANNLHQFNSRINLGYLATFWSLSAY